MHPTTLDARPLVLKQVRLYLTIAKNFEKISINKRLNIEKKRKNRETEKEIDSQTDRWIETQREKKKLMDKGRQTHTSDRQT